MPNIDRNIGNIDNDGKIKLSYTGIWKIIWNFVK